MKIRLLFIATAVFIISSCSKVKDDLLPSNSNSATTSSNSDATNLSNARLTGKPFKGSIYYRSTTSFDLPCNCSTFSPAGNFFGTGTLTHLGLSTSKIKPCVSLILSQGQVVGEHVGVECASFTSDCGDELYLDIHPYDILFTATGPVGNVNVDFVGGTGKFSHATGSFTGIVTIISSTDATLTNINGTIRY